MYIEDYFPTFSAYDKYTKYLTTCKYRQPLFSLESIPDKWEPGIQAYRVATRTLTITIQYAECGKNSPREQLREKFKPFPSMRKYLEIMRKE